MAAQACERVTWSLVGDDLGSCWVNPRSGGAAKRLLISSSGALGLHRSEPPSHQVQVRQREGGEQPRRVLHQAAIAHLGEAPQMLHHPESMLTARPHPRARTVDQPLILAQRLALVAAAGGAIGGAHTPRTGAP